MTNRIYFVNDNNTLRKIPVARWNRLQNHDPKETFPGYANKKVKEIVVFLELESRKPTQIIHMEGNYVSFDSNGKLPEEEMQRQMQEAAALFDDLFAQKKPGPTNVIDAAPKFRQKAYKNKYRWEITPDIANKIVTDIFG